ncbi:MAG TPA: T9SS type A sorting domain-containing protein, partial [Chitinophagaceae bacterium]|nr:T9SS type A sorting domain-containing protein [Chitinophagaceae bacterium]
VLLQEYYKDSVSNNAPINNNLLKNILINGSTHLLTEGPNYQYGYGLVNAKESKRILQEGTYWEDIIQSNTTKTFTFQVPNNTTEFKVLLSWNDPAAHPNAAKALVHDLDLKVIDPNNNTYFPWVLNPLSDQVGNPAIRSVDTLNNLEQVSILNPLPGTYTIEVSAAFLLENQQNFALSYIIDDSYLDLHYPVNNLSLDVDNKLHFYWENSKDLHGNTALFYSIDNQSSWIPIKTDISNNKRDYEWNVPSSLANKTLQFKIVKDNKEQILSDGVFFSKRPEIFTPSLDQQCWGSIKFNWAPLVDVDSYAVYLLTDKEIRITDTTTSLSYKFTGLQADKTYWYAVAPIANGKLGIRSIADYLKPQGTSCNGNGIAGDLTILKSNNLPFGREATSNALSSNEEIPIRIKNISNGTIANFRIHYTINNNSWEYQDFLENLQSNEEATVYLSAIDLSMPGFYSFNVVIENLDQIDPIPSNDSLSFTIAHLENPEIDLNTTYIEDFENWSSFDERENSYGLNLQNSWDFFPHTNFGRTYITDVNLWAINGQKSLCLDNYRNISQELADSSQNTLRATWNLGHENAYQSEIKLKFNYILHKKNTNGNKIQIRGSDTSNWIDAYLFPNDEDSAYSIQNSPNISLSKLLKDNNQNFSSSFQMQVIQRDSTKISYINYGTGITLDDIEIHKVFNDLELKAFNLEDNISCENNSINFNIEIENHVNNTVLQVPVSIYNGENLLITEIIDSIEAQSIISYTFQSELSTNLEEIYSLYAVLHHPADSYAYNDSSDIILIRQQKTINNFPYFENFDNSDGGYFSFGKNNSWEYGKINSLDLKNPYEENKSWKTNLTGYSNAQEYSFLYSPCFDIGNLQSPYLSFMASFSFSDYNIEVEEEVLDYAKIEYSYNGKDWYAIPDLYQYYLYKNSDTVWTGEDLTWRPYSLQIPQEEDVVQFRWLIKNGTGATKEGIAIDNIHIYDFKFPIGIHDSFTIEKEIQANEEVWGVENQSLSFFVPENNTSYLKINSFLNAEAETKDGLEGLYAQMWIINPLNISENYTIQFAILDSLLEEDKLKCYSCSSRSSIYDYDFNIYSGDEGHINKEIKDNTDNKWMKYPLKDFNIIPYGKGYLVELHAKERGEVWLLNSSLIKRENPNKSILYWTLNHFDENGAVIKWEFGESIINDISSVQVMNYTYNENFESRKQKFINEEARVVDYPDILDNIARYKLRITTRNNQVFYTQEKSLIWDENLFYWKLFPNPNKGPDLNLFYAINSLKPIYYEIIQSDGKVIERKTLNLKEQTGHIKLPSSHLMNGSYYLKIIQSDKEKVFPFIKL